MPTRRTTQDDPADLGLLDVPAIEALTGLSHDFVRKLVYGRSLPTVRIGRRVFVRRSVLSEWIEQNTTPARER